jgi:uncharacterized protein YecE (DUF72 family)
VPQITVGTASWTGKTLIASRKFYPRGRCSAEDRLRFYASQFPVVEVDSSYYAMPSPLSSRPGWLFIPGIASTLMECQRQLGGYQLAVEFRNISWFNNYADQGQRNVRTLAAMIDRLKA